MSWLIWMEAQCFINTISSCCFFLLTCIETSCPSSCQFFLSFLSFAPFFLSFFLSFCHSFFLSFAGRVIRVGETYSLGLPAPENLLVFPVLPCTTPQILYPCHPFLSCHFHSVCLSFILSSFLTSFFQLFQNGQEDAAEKMVCTKHD